MKLFLSADIEGTAGIDTWDEATPGERMYPYFAAQMTREVAAACRAAGKLGLDVTVKDAHDIARNIDPSALPENASVLRGWIRDLYCMMGGLDTRFLRVCGIHRLSQRCGQRRKPAVPHHDHGIAAGYAERKARLRVCPERLYGGDAGNSRDLFVR